MQVTFSFGQFFLFLVMMMTHAKVGIWCVFGKPSYDIFISFFFLDRISLITKDEAEGSSVTSEEAEKVS